MVRMEDTKLLPLAAEIEAVLRKHARHVTALIGHGQGAWELSQYLEEILTGERLAFTVRAIRANLRATGPEDPPRSAAALFPSWFIAVTVWPGEEPVGLHRRPGGYLGLLSSLTAPAYEAPGGRHIAHWIVLTDGGRIAVRLAVFPNHRSSRAPLLIPVDLLSPEERDLLRLPEETDANREPELSSGR